MTSMIVNPGLFRRRLGLLYRFPGGGSNPPERHSKSQAGREEAGVPPTPLVPGVSQPFQSCLPAFGRWRSLLYRFHGCCLPTRTALEVQPWAATARVDQNERTALRSLRPAGRRLVCLHPPFPMGLPSRSKVSSRYLGGDAVSCIDRFPGRRSNPPGRHSKSQPGWEEAGLPLRPPCLSLGVSSHFRNPCRCASRFSGE